MQSSKVTSSSKLKSSKQNASVDEKKVSRSKVLPSLKSSKTKPTSTPSAKNKSETLDKVVPLLSAKTKPKTQSVNSTVNTRNTRSLQKCGESDKKSSRPNLTSSSSHLKSSNLLRSTPKPASRSSLTANTRRSSLTSAKQTPPSKSITKVRNSSCLQKSSSVRSRVDSKPKRVSSVSVSSHQSTDTEKESSTNLPLKRPAILQLPVEGKGLTPTAVVSPIQEKCEFPSNPMETSKDVSVEVSNKPSTPPSNMPRKSHSFPNLLILADDAVEQTTVKETNKDVEIIRKRDTRIGHDFKPCSLKEWVTWCDACGGIVLSLFNASVTCSKCEMVCHPSCAASVSLTCAADEKLFSQTHRPCKIEETLDERTLKEFNTIKRVLSNAEVHGRLEGFNQTVKGIQQMTLLEDGETFRGFIRILINISRPVSVMRPWTKLEQRKISERKAATFYLEKGSVKALHVTSDSTAEQVVRMLLHKFNITDNPMKFALYERQAREEGDVILRKMLPRERPLFLRLLWGNTDKEFLLQENESRDIEWEAFSMAELQMFIKILDKEEGDHVTQIRKKYGDKAEEIRRAMEHQEARLD